MLSLRGILQVLSPGQVLTIALIRMGPQKTRVSHLRPPKVDLPMGHWTKDLLGVACSSATSESDQVGFVRSRDSPASSRKKPCKSPFKSSRTTFLSIQDSESNLMIQSETEFTRNLESNWSRHPMNTGASRKRSSSMRASSSATSTRDCSSRFMRTCLTSCSCASRGSGRAWVTRY